jgi:demethylmenaquinone methyltransferase/2-methoxy-6-polyprenyl-1,4-benzoquinol methylase
MSDIVDERGAPVERMFSAIAPRYDFLNRLLSAGRDRAWRREAIRAARLPAGGRLLDVCTGTADMALEAVRQFPTAQLVGVDFSRPMLALGLQKVARAGLEDRIRLEVAPAEALPFPDGAFDAATIAFGLRNIPDQLRGLRELFRVIRPGGRAVILEFTTPERRLFRAVYLWYFHRVLPRIGRLVSGHPSAYTYLPASVARFPSPQELASSMREVGFSEVTYRLMTAGIVAVHVGQRAQGRSRSVRRFGSSGEREREAGGREQDEFRMSNFELRISKSEDGTAQCAEASSGSGQQAALGLNNSTDSITQETEEGSGEGRL